MGELHGAPIAFESVEDVPCGGVLLALPALLQNGLLALESEHFSMPEGYYPLESIFLLLAFMALARIPSIEALRYQAPGEWGKFLGLDRIPEVRTLRAKLSALCSQTGQASAWSSTLAKEWMEVQAPQAAGVFYADGHVRVYHGKLTKLPRRYIARERLCLRGTTDYWVNAMDGQPFFVVTRPLDPGILQVLREDIVPRLEREAPNQPHPAALEADPLLSRLTLVFDREGYSPPFFAEMKKQRIAILSHHNGKLSRELAAFAAASLPENPTPAEFSKWEHKKATLQQSIEERRLRIENLKTERKAAGKHIEIKNLPPSDRFSALRRKKHFIDTIKLIAYRAETAMAGLVREHLSRHDDARSLLRQIYESAVDIPTRSGQQDADSAPAPSQRPRSRRSDRKTLRRTHRNGNRISGHRSTPDFSVRRLILIPLDQEV